MILQLPDHAKLTVVVGDRPEPLAMDLTQYLARLPTEPRSGSRRRTGLKLLGVGALVALAFLAGQHQRARLPRLNVASNAALMMPHLAAPGPALRPGHPASAAPEEDRIPPAFAQQLQQPPAITPPPGSPPANAPAGPRAFGLED